MTIKRQKLTALDRYVAVNRRRSDTLSTPVGAEAEELRAAALALIAEAGGRHRIEQTVRVYLLLDTDGSWSVDPIMMDGHALDGLVYGAGNGTCGHADPALDVECNYLKMAADDAARLPTGAELTALMATAPQWRRRKRRRKNR